MRRYCCPKGEKMECPGHHHRRNFGKTIGGARILFSNIIYKLNLIQLLTKIKIIYCTKHCYTIVITSVKYNTNNLIYVNIKVKYIKDYDTMIVSVNQFTRLSTFYLIFLQH